MRKPVFGVSDQVMLKEAYSEKLNLVCSKFRYDTFHLVNNKGADQTAWMRWLVCTFVVCKP